MSLNSICPLLIGIQKFKVNKVKYKIQGFVYFRSLCGFKNYYFILFIKDFTLLFFNYLLFIYFMTAHTHFI